MNWFNNLFRNKVREKALQLGLIVREVDRAIPLTNRDNSVRSLVTQRCICYALPRKTARKSNWRLLQRDEAHDANLPNGYQLVAEDTGARVLDKFRPIAEEFSEEYFEFEGTPDEVMAFWEEWGDSEQAVRLRRALTSLQDI